MNPSMQLNCWGNKDSIMIVFFQGHPIPPPAAFMENAGMILFRDDTSTSADDSEN